MSEIPVKRNIDERIISFFKANTNLTLATCADNIPHCSNCFYAFDEERNYLVFKSNRETLHIKQALLNNNVAGTVAPDKLNPASIRGIQLGGKFSEPKGELLDGLKKIYYKKYPFAFAFSGEIWAIELTFIKMTDNTLGFGKKIEWSERTPPEKK